jgi:hypothetical protein
MVRSRPAEKSRWPSGLKVRAHTGFLCDSNRRGGLGAAKPFEVSQRAPCSVNGISDAELTVARNSTSGSGSTFAVNGTRRSRSPCAPAAGVEAAVTRRPAPAAGRIKDPNSKLGPQYPTLPSMLL